jgi:hypothetical protein
VAYIALILVSSPWTAWAAEVGGTDRETVDGAMKKV